MIRYSLCACACNIRSLTASQHISWLPSVVLYFYWTNKFGESQKQKMLTKNHIILTLETKNMIVTFYAVYE